MKNYTITVNGNVYQVTVEETATGAAPAPAAAPAAPAAPVPAPAPAAPAAGAGAVRVEAPMMGKILDIKCSVGQQVKRGDGLFTLEAMKMENEIVAPSDGTVASIDVNKGDTVESGTVLATLD